jgi:hypothetical protein
MDPISPISNSSFGGRTERGNVYACLRIRARTSARQPRQHVHCPFLRPSTTFSRQHKKTTQPRATRTFRSLIFDISTTQNPNTTTNNKCSSVSQYSSCVAVDFALYSAGKIRRAPEFFSPSSASVFFARSSVRRVVPGIPI